MSLINGQLSALTQCSQVPSAYPVLRGRQCENPDISGFTKTNKFYNNQLVL